MTLSRQNAVLSQAINVSDNAIGDTIFIPSGNVVNLSGILTATSGNFTNSLQINGTGVITEIVQDISPQLGGDLDLNGFNINGVGDVVINGNVLCGYLVPGTIISSNDFDGATPGTISIGDYTSFSHLNWSINENGSGNFSSLTMNNSGVALYDTTVANLGTISGTNSINCGQDRQIQTLTLNGTATTFTKGSGWPTNNNISRETTLNIYASGNTSITWTIVNDWYRQPDSPLPSGRHIVLLRSIGSGTMQGHYIGNKTN